MSKQWLFIVSLSDNIINKEVLLWKQRWIAAEDKFSCTFIDTMSFCDEVTVS